MGNRGTGVLSIKDPMAYLLVGHDPQKKDEKINGLKAKILKDPSAVAFDLEVLSAHKLDPDELKKSLMSLPHVAAQRLVVIRQCERLTEYNRDLLLGALSEKSKSLVLVLDFDDVDPKSAFFLKIKQLTQPLSVEIEKQANVFDMARLISARDTVGAIKMLHQIMGNSTHPLQVMGGLVWYWAKERERLGADRFVQGLMVLEEGDLNIKRSKLDPQHAVEKVVVELALLQGA